MHSTEKFMISIILKNSTVFLKKHLFFLRKPSFWTFWQISRSQSHSTATLKVLEVLKNSRLSRKIRVFFRKTQVSNTLRIITISIAFHRKSSNFSDFKTFREFFFGKYQIFWENPVFERFEKLQCLSRFLQQAGYF